MIVYDVTCLVRICRCWKICLFIYFVFQSSFKAVQSWIKELRTYLSEQYIIAIAGNKSDLVDKRLIHSNGRETVVDCVRFLI